MVGTIKTVKATFHPWHSRRALRGVIAGVLLSTLSACTFEPPLAIRPFVDYFENEPISPVVDSGERKVFEDPGNMVVYHGFACAESATSRRSCASSRATLFRRR